MQVLKFGGTSVADATNISKVNDIVVNSIELDKTVLVCSAISKCTDTLIEIGARAAARDNSYLQLISELQMKHQQIIDELLQAEKRTLAQKECDELFDSLRSITLGVFLLGELSTTSLDAIQGMGELISTKIIARSFLARGVQCKWIDSRDIILTREVGGKNVVDTDVTYERIRQAVSDSPSTSLFILPGFIASDSKGRTTTLGRGGSDYTAALYAVALNARKLEIWTDVPGIMTANPKIVHGARTIRHISYRAALELSHFGAKVIYPPTIHPVVKEGIPIYVRNTFEPDAEGTVIEKNPPLSAEDIIGISNSDDIALISLEGNGMVGIPGFTSRFFDALSRADINIILITQASSVHTMCLAISAMDAEKARKATNECFAYEISLGRINPLKVEMGYSIVCVVGDDVIGHSGATGKMLAALGRNAIQVRATAQGSSERNISVIVPSERVNDAICQIHSEFFDKDKEKLVNIFIAGYGNVSRALLEMVAKNGERIVGKTGKRVRVCGISNSRKFIIDTLGIELGEGSEEIDALLNEGRNAADNAYFNALSELSIRNSVFVDCTASDAVAFQYKSLMKKGYSVVACNKIAFASSYDSYSALKQCAMDNGVKLRYDTTVGAAQPIIATIKRCYNSGDQIQEIRAVLSGTLNYIFSTYDSSRSFATVVREALEKGYTEPDPRLDLSGTDVLRKIVILSRENGIPLEVGDVTVKPLLEADYFEGDMNSFFDKLDQREESFRSRYVEASSRGHRLRYVASLKNMGSEWKAGIGLEEVEETDPLYNLVGTDNAVIIRTDLYPTSLVIQGRGAGAAQTASGILNDILKQV